MLIEEIVIYFAGNCYIKTRKGRWYRTELMGSAFGGDYKKAVRIGDDEDIKILQKELEKNYKETVFNKTKKKAHTNG